MGIYEVCDVKEFACELKTLKSKIKVGFSGDRGIGLVLIFLDGPSVT